MRRISTVVAVRYRASPLILNLQFEDKMSKGGKKHNGGRVVSVNVVEEDKAVYVFYTRKNGKSSCITFKRRKDGRLVRELNRAVNRETYVIKKYRPRIGSGTGQAELNGAPIKMRFDYCVNPLAKIENNMEYFRIEKVKVIYTLEEVKTFANNLMRKE